MSIIVLIDYKIDLDCSNRCKAFVICFLVILYRFLCFSCSDDSRLLYCNSTPCGCMYFLWSCFFFVIHGICVFYSCSIVFMSMLRFVLFIVFVYVLSVVVHLYFLSVYLFFCVLCWCHSRVFTLLHSPSVFVFFCWL